MSAFAWHSLPDNGHSFLLFFFYSELSTSIIQGWSFESFRFIHWYKVCLVWYNCHWNFQLLIVAFKWHSAFHDVWFDKEKRKLIIDKPCTQISLQHKFFRNYTLPPHVAFFSKDSLAFLYIPIKTVRIVWQGSKKKTAVVYWNKVFKLRYIVVVSIAVKTNR